MEQIAERRKTLLCRATGIFILGLDWILFSQNALALGLATPLTAVFGFCLGGIGTTLIQRRVGGDPWGSALAKGLLGAVVVGVPWPIVGTTVGAWILFASGITPAATHNSEVVDSLPPTRDA